MSLAHTTAHPVGGARDLPEREADTLEVILVVEDASQEDIAMHLRREARVGPAGVRMYCVTSSHGSATPTGHPCAECQSPITLHRWPAYGGVDSRHEDMVLPRYRAGFGFEMQAGCMQASACSLVEQGGGIQG